MQKSGNQLKKMVSKIVAMWSNWYIYLAEFVLDKNALFAESKDVFRTTMLLCTNQQPSRINPLHFLFPAECIK